MPRLTLGNWFWQATCLKPTYSLRRQVLVSFGITGMLSIFLVVALGCFTALSAGNHARTQAKQFMREQVIASIVNSSQYAAETFSEELDHLRGTASLIVEITRDRIAGYPRPGWEKDLFVPFQSEDQTSQYPLRSPLLPRDWNLTFNVHATNANEHLQETLYMMDKQQYHDHPHSSEESFVPHHVIMRISTASALYFFQGNCDPEVQNPGNFKYYPNCTVANNNGTTGGVIWPTSTNAALEQGAADIGTLLKPIWESRPDILFAGVFFANEGAGSMVHFPSFVHHNRDDGYISIGCDWLHENKNRYTNAPFFSKTTTSKCHPAGTWVNHRDYNVLEQEWCRDQALHPNETRFFGPFVDDLFTPGGLFKTHTFDLRLWVVRVGRAVFDRYTNEFIGCVAVDVLLNRFSDLMGAGPDKSRQLIPHNYSEAVLVKRTDGQVVAGGGWNGTLTNSTLHVSETDLVPDRSSFEELLEDLEDTERQYQQTSKDPNQPRQEENVFSVPTIIIERDNKVLSASSLPNTDFIFILSVGSEVFDVIDEVKAEIDEDVTNLVVLSLLIGMSGVAILMLIVWTVSAVLTQPLDWMRIVAWRIVNHTDSSVERDALKVHEDQDSDAYVGSGKDKYSTNILRWTPRSEITQLVFEFKNMIRGFSGRDYASTVANPLVKEVRNLVTWQSDFKQVYQPSAPPGCEEENTAALNSSLSNLDSTGEHDTGGISAQKISASAKETKKEGRSESSGGNRFLRRMSNEFGNGHFRRRSSAGDSSNEDILKERNSRGSTSRSSRILLATKNLENSREKENDENVDADASSEAEEMFRSSRMKPEDPKIVLKPRHSEAASVALSATTNTSSTRQHLPVKSLVQEWQNKGRHTCSQHKAPRGAYHASQDHGPAINSMLFRWIMVLIVIPMLVTNVVIVALVSSRLTSVLPEWLSVVGSAAFDIALYDLAVSSKLAALYAESTLATPVRDLFLLTRISGWLYTDAVKRNMNAFTTVDTSTELCKHYETDVYSCPWYDEIFENVPCDCKWEDPEADNCFRMGNDLDTRNLQKLFWAGQSSDSDPDTGRRSKSSYPETDGRPETTSWYTNASKVPGSWQEASAAGYNTSYDRLRVFSALSVIVFPIYNYRPALVAKGSHRFLGIFMGFELDGMLSGWGGCRHPSSSYAFFQSSDKNLAYSVNASLCPKGKYGYDPRCREWYASGKSKAMRMPDISSSLHIAAPYEFASPNTVASSATQAIIDPQTGEHIGQALIDFLQFEILNFGLQQDSDSFYFVITPSDEGGGDTVVAPGHNVGTSQNIINVLLKNDDHDSLHRLAFEDILKDMKAGLAKTVNFTRATSDGESESIWLAFDPIYVRALEALQNNDYARGVRVSQSLVYSLGVGRTLTALQKPFMGFEDSESEVLQRQILLYVTLAVCLSLLIMAVTYQISVAITRPMTTLLGIVQNINAGRIDHDIPPLFGGSREVNQVYTSFAKLFKIVRVSNTAFFSGNLEWACHFVRDALKLFMKVGDPKAVAIASNNLGNTLLAMSSSRSPEQRCSCLKINNSCVIKEAFACYETAIHSATEEFTTARDLHKKAEFAEQLADRHFNRSLYFSISRNDPCSPEDAGELGYQDLMKAHALDHDVQDYMVKNNLLLEKSGILFDRLIRRIYGLIALHESGIEQTLWDPNELVYDCHRLLTAAWDDFTAPLFHELDRFGRLQQLEGAMILLELHRKNDVAAARLAMRMLAEDEFLNEFSFRHAAEAVLQFTAGDHVDCLSWSSSSKDSAQRDIRSMLKSCKRSSPVMARKCFFLCIDLGNLQQSSPKSMDEISKQLLGLYDSSCAMDDYFGLLASKGSHGCMMTMEVECRQQKMDGHHQRSAIETAILSLCDPPVQTLSSKGVAHSPCKALMNAVDKVVKSDAPSYYDSYIVFVTDARKEHWDSRMVCSVKQEIEEMNSKREGDIHIILFNLLLDSEEEHHASSSEGEGNHEKMCPNLCEVSQGSHYMESTLERLQDDFEEVRSIMSFRNESPAMHNAALMAGITMEKF